jgi:hypothetical protein
MNEALDVGIDSRRLWNVREQARWKFVRSGMFAGHAGITLCVSRSHGRDIPLLKQTGTGKLAELSGINGLADVNTDVLEKYLRQSSKFRFRRR